MFACHIEQGLRNNYMAWIVTHTHTQTHTQSQLPIILLSNALNVPQNTVRSIMDKLKKMWNTFLFHQIDRLTNPTNLNVQKCPKCRQQSFRTDMGETLLIKTYFINHISAGVCPQACEWINNLEDDCTVCWDQNLTSNANYLIAKANVSHKSNKMHLKVNVFLQRNIEVGHAKLKKKNKYTYDQRNPVFVSHQSIPTVCWEIVHPKWTHCHHLLSFISFQTCMHFFVLGNTKETFWKMLPL